MEITPVYFSAGGVAERLGVAPWVVSRLIADGRLRPTVRLLGGKRDTFGFSAEEVDRVRLGMRESA